MILKANKELKQKDFKNEKELQNFFENNIETILGYKFIDTEFVVGDFRIDSLAFDEESKSFRIIEYKNVKNHSLVDQGYTYLKLMLERKADFVLQYNIKTRSSLTTQDIDWSQSRIIFVAPIYTAYQLNATDFKNIPVDLVKLTRYEDDIIEIDFIKKTSNVKVQDIQMESIQNDVNKEIIVYTEEDHLSKVSDNIKRVYEELKNRILELDDIDVEAKKLYIAFKGSRNITDIEFHKNKLKVYINMKKGSLNDPLKIAKDISNTGHWGNGDYCVTINSEDEIDNILGVLNQKDFHNYIFNTKQALNSIIRPVLFITPNMKIGTLLKNLQAGKSHIAIILDEFGGTEGLVTMEDIVEELVGEIWDEHDEVIQEIQPVSQDEYLVMGSTNVDKLFEKLGIEKEFEVITVSGWVMEYMECLPKENDSFISDGLEVTVLKMNDRRIEQVRVRKISPSSGNSNDTTAS